MYKLSDVPSDQIRQYCFDLNKELLPPLTVMVQDLQCFKNHTVSLEVPNRAIVDKASDWSLEWSYYFNDEWRTEPCRFGVAFMDGANLCGLLLGRFDPRNSALRVFMLEGNPSSAHAFKGYILEIADMALEAASVQAGVSSIRIEQPTLETINLYERVGYSFIDGHPGYCLKVLSR